jgi:endo-1,4-beta-xylanase
MPDLLDDPAYADTVARHFDCVVVEHHMKWGPLCSRPDARAAGAPASQWGKQRPPCRSFSPLSGCYDFGPSDKVVDWALSRGLAVKGHVLLWHVTSPGWLEALPPPQLREAVRRHIHTTVGHFRGRVGSWDVANECLAPDGTLAGTLFTRRLGQSIIDDAFRWAREAAGPGVLLIYNDNKVEGCAVPPPGPPAVADGDDAAAAAAAAAAVAAGGGGGDDDDARYCCDFYRKSDAMYALLKGMLERGVPVGGVGLQAHFTASGVGTGRCPTPAAVAANVRRLGELGLRVNISEMDVRTSKLPRRPPRAGAAAAGGASSSSSSSSSSSADAASAAAAADDDDGAAWRALREEAQTCIYGGVLGACVAEPAFDGVTFWGFTDKHSWVHQFYHEDEPLLFDASFAPKPALEAVRTALRGASGGGGGGCGSSSSTTAGTAAAAPPALPWGARWMLPEPAPEPASAVCIAVAAAAAAATTTASGDDRPDWELGAGAGK